MLHRTVTPYTSQPKDAPRNVQAKCSSRQETTPANCRDTHDTANVLATWGNWQIQEISLADCRVEGKIRSEGDNDGRGTQFALAQPAASAA
jgi:hypothetical protein